MSCGAEVSEGDGHEVRKTVTILFSDVAGSTAMGDALDPEAVRRVMGQYFDACRSVIEFHGGTIEKFIGDAVMAVFGVPVVREDDAMRAMRAADGIRAALASLNEDFDRQHGVRLVVRTGINTGEVMAGDPGAGQAFVSGDSVNVAARLEQEAAPGEILLSGSTLQLVRDAVDVEPVEPLALKGKPEPFPAFRLVSVDAAREGVARRSGEALVGRSEELSQLEQAFERAVDQRRCWMVTVIGQPGVGKSRLVDAFADLVSPRATILRGRCLSYGKGITFFPAAEIVAQVIGSGQDDTSGEIRDRIERAIAHADDGPLVSTRLLRMLGLGTEDSQGAPEEIYWAVRKLLESAARHAPVVAVIDDIQWAEPALLDLLEHVCDLSREAPIVLVCMTRPDIVDERPGWGAGRANASSIVLEPLGEGDSQALAAQLMVGSNVDPDVTGRILEAAQGNPLFIEQVIAHLVDQRISDATAAGDREEVTIPGSLTALLEARLDSLSDLQRAVLQRGSIEGQVFHRGAVSSLLPSDLRSEVASSFGPLMQKEFISPGEAELAGEDAFRFRHLLIKDAAYRALPKETRAELHERLADWLEDVAGPRLPELEEIVAYHLEAAFRYREELGSAAAASALAHRAAARFAAAGERASKRGDVGAATSLLGRAAELGDPGHHDRVHLLLKLADVAESAGQTDLARKVWREIDAKISATSDDPLRAAVMVQRLDTELMEEADLDWPATVHAETDVAIPILERAGDAHGLAAAFFVRGNADWVAARISSAVAAWELAATRAIRAGDSSLEAEALSWIGVAWTFGATPVDHAVPQLEALSTRVAGMATAAGIVDCALSISLAIRGDDLAAGTAADRARELWREHGLQFYLAHFASQGDAWVARCRGDPDAESLAWQEGLEASRRIDQEDEFLAVNLARLVAARGDADGATRLMDSIAHEAASGNRHVRDVWVETSAIVGARHGEAAEARQACAEIAEIIENTEFVIGAADGWMTIALVHRLLHDMAACDAAVERALDLYRAKGATALIAEAERWRNEPVPPTVA
jgi:class 3 adenylate cyclase